MRLLMSFYPTMEMMCAAQLTAQVVQYYAGCEKTLEGTHAGMRAQH